eukprot:914986-Rhodomonas_salina.3
MVLPGERAPHARFCHPREEHLLPLFVIAGTPILYVPAHQRYRKRLRLDIACAAGRSSRRGQRRGDMERPRCDSPFATSCVLASDDHHDGASLFGTEPELVRRDVTACQCAGCSLSHGVSCYAALGDHDARGLCAHTPK